MSDTLFPVGTRPVDKVPDIFFKNPLRTAISYLLLSDLQQKKEISSIFFRGVSLRTDLGLVVRIGDQK